MGSVWMQCVRESLAEALDLLSVVVRDCPDDLWCAPMWHVRASEIIGEVYDDNGNPITDPHQREPRIQRWSQPWSVAWHALEVLDYDLSGELDTWTQPRPFAGNPHWRTFTSLPAAWTRSEITGYIDHCRVRVHDTFADMTDERAATPLPAAHRYAGKPYASLITSLIGHTTAHATQIRQFTNDSGTRASL